MKVHGIDITPAQVEAGLAAMTGDFDYRGVTRAMYHAGAPLTVADRAADRLLQRERRPGRIIANGRMWQRNDGGKP